MKVKFLKNINSLIGDKILKNIKSIFMRSKKIFFSMLYIYMEDNQGKFQDGKKMKILYIVIWDIISIWLNMLNLINIFM